MDTASGIVPPDPDGVPEPSAGRRRRGRAVAVVAAVVLVAGMLLAATLDLDYIAFYPGDTEPTGGRIEIEGAEVFVPDGGFAFVTVRSREPLSPIELLVARLDSTVDVFDREEILGDLSSDERQTVNQQLMLGSQETAELVALEALGLDLVTGSGAEIMAVVPDSAADGVLDEGETVVGIDGTEIDFGPDLARAVGDRSPGDGVVLSVVPAGGGEAEDRTVVLGDGGDRALLGVQVGTRDLDIDEPPVDIEFEASGIGGPSAGLAWTLTIIDDLTPGELTGGGRVAVTGTIEITGDVGRIGGVRQKVAAARREGMEYFIVPADDADDALSAAGDEIEIVGVETLDDALDFLGGIGGNADSLAAPALLDRGA